MDAEHSTSWWGRVAWGIGSCLLTVLLYIGSVGPLILALPSGHGEQYPLLEKFYAPVEWLERTPLGGPIDAYVTWWRSLKGP